MFGLFESGRFTQGLLYIWSSFSIIYTFCRGRNACSLLFIEPSSTSMTSLNRLVGVFPTILYTVLNNTDKCSSRNGMTTLISGRLMGYRRSLQLTKNIEDLTIKIGR